MRNLVSRARAWLNTRAGRIVSRDVVVSVAAGYAVFQASGGQVSWGLVSLAGMAALKTLLRKVIPDLLDAGGIITTNVTVNGLTRDSSREIDKTLRSLMFGKAGVRTTVLPELAIATRRLGRHVEHDVRSLAFAIEARELSTLVSVRHKRHAGVFDQGNLGSCTGNAMAGALSTAPFTHRFREATAVKLYELATTLDNVPGQYPPDDTGSSGIAVAKAAQKLGYITSYRHCFSLEQVLTAMQDGPVILGVSWRTGFDSPASDGRMTYTGDVRGGHEICADEIDVENKRVWITNSWGRSWGVDGRAYWTWQDLASVLADSGDATVPKA